VGLPGAALGRGALAFSAALEAVPDDGPSMTFIKRLDSLALALPGDGWDGSKHLEQTEEAAHRSPCALRRKHCPVGPPHRTE
jgi:hypothetical protein